MNILFLTLSHFESINDSLIYTDLLREFLRHGHSVYSVSPNEKKLNQETRLITEGRSVILQLRIGNTQKTNILEKGISTLLIEYQYKKAIKKYFSKVVFDLVIYSTPPITLYGPILYIKQRDRARTYLLLKDIFPQNAVDLGLMSKDGFRGIVYRYFRKKETRLYGVSDRIGCMSEANVDYVLQHNPQVRDINEKSIKSGNGAVVEVCPNCIDAVDMSVDDGRRRSIREKYCLPLDKIVFVYGGNLGMPQGIPFLIKCLNECKNIEDTYFLIVGDGTEYPLISKFIEDDKPNNVSLMKSMPKNDYDAMIAACDVGMIFLDYRFTIPNFPSRILSYMQAKLPVLTVTDPNTDIGDVVINGRFGWKCNSDSVEEFKKTIVDIASKANLSVDSKDSLDQMGINAYEYLIKYYNVEDSYRIIVDGNENK